MVDGHGELRAIVDALAAEFPDHAKPAIEARVRRAFDRTAGSPLTSYRLSVTERVARSQLREGSGQPADGTGPSTSDDGRGKGR